jgi:hypothetical protein
MHRTRFQKRKKEKKRLVGASIRRGEATSKKAALRLHPDDRTHAEQDRGLQQTFSVEGCRPNPAGWRLSSRDR